MDITNRFSKKMRQQDAGGRLLPLIEAWDTGRPVASKSFGFAVSG
ncbi:MAG: hypothetical protein Q7T86_18345 [Hyphomicrobiaceae bacterium]|nr:hypothetical protein [Hyphomicrobiaceae bacterium]